MYLLRVRGPIHISSLGAGQSIDIYVVGSASISLAISPLFFSAARAVSLTRHCAKSPTLANLKYNGKKCAHSKDSSLPTWVYLDVFTR